MPDFSTLLSKPLDSIKRPPPLPAGTYMGTIKSYEALESKEKKTPYIRFNLNLVSPGQDIDPNDLNGIDLSKRQLRRDFFLTPDAEYRLKEFLESLGIDTKGRTFQSTLPDSLNQAVQIEVVQRLNQDEPTAPPFNDVKSVSGAK